MKNTGYGIGIKKGDLQIWEDFLALHQKKLVMYLLKEFEENPSEIWDTNIFGKSLHELVSEGLNNKLYRMPIDARNKLRETIERVINEGCNGLICIIL